MDHLVPRCSDCGRGYCKIGTRCTTCWIEHAIGRCVDCGRGYKKFPNGRCTTCFIDLFRSRCGSCRPREGEANSEFLARRGWAKFGSRCTTCFYQYVKQWLLTSRLCAVCNRGYAKIGSRCFTCYKAHAFPPCIDCGVGASKIGARCFKCFIAYFRNPPACFVCHRGSA